MSFTFQNAFAALSEGKLSPALVEEAMDAILRGTWNPTQVAGFMVGVRLTGETPEFIGAAARALRRHMIVLPHGEKKLLDTCGTGGDGSQTVNLSTGAAILAAACGAKVAKHGNRAATSLSGSADVLEKLGINLSLTPEQEANVLREAGIVFLFAQTHHPALRHIGPARKDLGVRTMFNCLGPLANPANATHQLLGAYDDALRPTLALALKEVGVARAWVIRSEDGMDEVSPYATTRVTVLDDGHLREMTIRPEDFGLTPSAPGAIAGGTPDENARILHVVLRGEPHPSRDAFVLNAAAALAVYDGGSFTTARERVDEALSSGAALRTLEAFRAASQAC